MRLWERVVVPCLRAVFGPRVGLRALALIMGFLESELLGRIVSLDELMRRLEADEFDLVAVGRALIANPEWPRLVAEGRTADLEAFHVTMLGALA